MAAPKNLPAPFGPLARQVRESSGCKSREVWCKTYLRPNATVNQPAGFPSAKSVSRLEVECSASKPLLATYLKASDMVVLNCGWCSELIDLLRSQITSLLTKFDSYIPPEGKFEVTVESQQPYDESREEAIIKVVKEVDSDAEYGGHFSGSTYYLFRLRNFLVDELEEKIKKQKLLWLGVPENGLRKLTIGSEFWAEDDSATNRVKEMIFKISSREDWIDNPDDSGLAVTFGALGWQDSELVTLIVELSKKLGFKLPPQPGLLSQPNPDLFPPSSGLSSWEIGLVTSFTNFVRKKRKLKEVESIHYVPLRDLVDFVLERQNSESWAFV